MIRLALGIIFAILTAAAIDGGADDVTCVTLSTASMLFSVWFLFGKAFGRSQ